MGSFDINIVPNTKMFWYSKILLRNNSLPSNPMHTVLSALNLHKNVQFAKLRHLIVVIVQM